ncbi:hypothetical protein JIG36_43415 [Actinoplanes sp. LDG1-06]|uniref:Uncharacterized protein n=1 Tax=Paractinoplanes ovalisporus TaxID=2810368 RepID=A0ABS2ASM4_9ACTN|nr:hypothetical protein [Actinoplanes ovalisporus]MBM2622373.1 hypothetical protein [Actinoplanes ovalisporus]
MFRVAGFGTSYFGGQAAVPMSPGSRPAVPPATPNDGVLMREFAGTPVQHLVAAHPSDP